MHLCVWFIYFTTLCNLQFLTYFSQRNLHFWQKFCIWFALLNYKISRSVSAPSLYAPNVFAPKCIISSKRYLETHSSGLWFYISFSDDIILILWFETFWVIKILLELIQKCSNKFGYRVLKPITFMPKNSCY